MCICSVFWDIDARREGRKADDCREIARSFGPTFYNLNSTLLAEVIEVSYTIR